MTQYTIRVNELRTHGLCATGARQRLMAAAALAVASLFSSHVLAAGGIKVDKVARGSATVETVGRNTVIRASDRAVINFRQFDLAKGRNVRFIQPDETSRVLSRITGGLPSRIDGRIVANGQLYFVNPAGIVFGRDSSVKANSFVAAAANLSDANFLRGTDSFSGGAGSVLNAGTIEADFAGLIGGRVSNTGTITASDGVVAMLSGSDVTLVRRGDTVSVKVSGGMPGLTPGASNDGVVTAGKRVVIGAGDLYSLAVQNRGTVKSANVTLQATAGKGAIVDVGGTLDASSKTDVGGHIEVLGDRVALQAATLDASGETGGGTVLVGGDWQGSGTTPHAKAVYVDAKTSIHADATESGDGGKVVAWSDDSTRFHGSVTALGSTSGNGGRVETSGRSIDVEGAQVRTSSLTAKDAEGGTWLLDPRNVLILAIPDDAALNTTTNSAGATVFEPISPFDNAADNNTAILTPNTITNALASNGEVIVQTGINTFAPTAEQLASPQLMRDYVANTIRPNEGRITVLSPIVYTGTRAATLTMRANGGIDVQQSITATNAPLNINLLAREGYWDRGTQRFKNDGVLIAETATGGSPVTDNVEAEAIVIRRVNTDVDVAITTNGGDLYARGRYVQTSLDDPSPANLGKTLSNSLIDTRSKTSATGGGDVTFIGEGNVEFGHVVTGGGDVTFRAGQVLTVSGTIDEFAPFAFTIVAQRGNTALDAGSGDVHLLGSSILLRGDSIKGHDVRLQAFGNRPENTSTVTRDVSIVDFVSDLLFNRELGPTTVSGTDGEIDALAAAYRRQTNDPTFRKYAINASGDVLIDANLRLYAHYSLATSSTDGDITVAGGFDGQGRASFGAPRGTVRFNGGVGVFETRANATDAPRGAVPLTSLDVAARRIEASTIYAQDDVNLHASGPDGSIVVKGTNPVWLSSGTFTVNRKPVFDLDENSIAPVFGTPGFRADTNNLLYEFDQRDLQTSVDNDPPAVFTAPGFFVSNIASTDEYNIQVAAGNLSPYADVFNLVSFSPTARSAANEIAGAVPQTSRSTEVARAIPSNLQGKLRGVGVNLRGVEAEEVLSMLSGRATYNDTAARPPYVKFEVGANDYNEIATPRISATVAAQVVDQYDLTVNRPATGPDGRIVRNADGGVTLIDHKDALKSNLAAAVTAYSAAHPGDIDPVALRAYIAQTPAHAEAAKDLANLQQLFRLVENLGLSQREVQYSREQVAIDLAPTVEGFDQPTFIATVLNRPLPKPNP